MTTDIWETDDPGQRQPTKETPEGQYPQQKVFRTAGDFVFAWSDEKGKESFKLFSPSGSYVEMQPDGSMISVVVGESRVYNKSGGTVTTDDNMSSHTYGHQQSTVAGGIHIEVQGDAGITVGGKTALVALGDLGMSVNGNMYLGTKGNISMNAMGKMDIQVQGDISMNTKANMTMMAQQSMSQGTGEKHSIQASEIAM